MKRLFKKIIVLLLQTEAKLVLRKYKPKIVAITGSVGKTSSKDAIYTALTTAFFVRKSSKSFNSEIGVPLTILGLPNAWDDPKLWLKNLIDGLNLFLFPHKYPEWLVIEVGADRPGDIKSVAKWLKPDIAIVTRLSEVPVHVEFFNSAEQVRQEKAELVLAASDKSTVILNADDNLVSSMRPMAKGRVLTYGMDTGADVVGSDFGLTYDMNNSKCPIGVSFAVNIADQKIPVEIHGTLGKQQMYIALAALTVAKALNLNLEDVARGLRDHDAPPGRARVLPGANNSCIIDDSYNSSPVAVHEALDTLSLVKTKGRKIAVLGDMLELGVHSKREHEKVGEKTVRIADELYTVGTRAKGIHDAAIEAGLPKEKAFWFSDSEEAGAALKKVVGEGDVVLVKGSQGIRTEKVVKAILDESVNPSNALVRQEEEWKNR